MFLWLVPPLTSRSNLLFIISLRRKYSPDAIVPDASRCLLIFPPRSKAIISEMLAYWGADTWTSWWNINFTRLSPLSASTIGVPHDRLNMSLRYERSWDRVLMPDNEMLMSDSCLLPPWSMNTWILEPLAKDGSLQRIISLNQDHCVKILRRSLWTAGFINNGWVIFLHFFKNYF